MKWWFGEKMAALVPSLYVHYTQGQQQQPELLTWKPTVLSTLPIWSQSGLSPAHLPPDLWALSWAFSPTCGWDAPCQLVSDPSCLCHLSAYVCSTLSEEVWPLGSDSWGLGPYWNLRFELPQRCQNLGIFCYCCSRGNSAKCKWMGTQRKFKWK